MRNPYLIVITGPNHCLYLYYRNSLLFIIESQHRLLSSCGFFSSNFIKWVLYCYQEEGVQSQDMKRGFIMVYSTLNPVEAQVVKFLFENNGIEAIIDNDKINFFFGIVSAKDAMVEIWVPGNKYEDA